MIFRKLFMSVASGELSTVAGETSEAANAGGAASFLERYSFIIILAAFALLFYFFLLRPEKKRKKEAQSLRDALKVGDTVITIGGITGEVESIRTETLTIFTGNNSIDVQKWAIRSVQASDSAEAAAIDIVDDDDEESK